MIFIQWLVGVVISSAVYAAAVNGPMVKATVNPHVLFPDGSINVTCRVERSDENRLLRMVVDGYTSHDVQLDGASAPITHQMQFQHIPCEATGVSCELYNSVKMTTVARMPLTVSCEGHQ